MQQVCYFDNAATTFPKPEAVYVAMDTFGRTVAANPGRGSHQLALAASTVVDDTRSLLARLFNVSDEARIIFTLNTTDALNMALHGLLGPGDHVVTSMIEHNAVIRPLSALQRAGVTVTRVVCDAAGCLDPEKVAAAMRPNTRLVVLTHASNVIGSITPIGEIGPIVRARGAYLLVDAAQSAGVLDIDVEKMGIDLLAFAGHKGLLGPQGTGGLVVGERVQLRPYRQGGTGTHSMLEEQPDGLPEALESGTMNGVGVAGLGAGVRFLLDVGLHNVRAREEGSRQQLVKGLRQIRGITVYGHRSQGASVAVVSITAAGWEPVDLGVALDVEFGIAVRTGLHCAPGAHRTIGTFPTGTIRLAPGYFNSPADVDAVLAALEQLCARRQHKQTPR